MQPTLFTRNNLPLHALIHESKAWFCAQDIGRLIGYPLAERTLRKLDTDQYRTLFLRCHGEERDTLLVSESGLYALLVYHYYPENRRLRRWITLQVVPALLHAEVEINAEKPSLSILEWPQANKALSVLHWQDEPWIRLRDMPVIAPTMPRARAKASDGWFTFLKR